LHRRRQAMDLVDEERVALVQRGEVPGENALVLDRGTRGEVQPYAELAREDLRHRGLAQARRTVQERVIERLAAFTSRAHEHGEPALEGRLSHVLVERARAKARAEILVDLLLAQHA